MAKRSEYGQFCPVAMTSEILAVRWTPLLVRELLCGSHRFSDLQKGLPLISPSLLSTRLRELEFAGVIERKKAPSGKGSCASAASGRAGSRAARWYRASP